MRAYLCERVLEMARLMLVAMIRFITELTPKQSRMNSWLFNGFRSWPVICSFYQPHDATINYFI